MQVSSATPDAPQRTWAASPGMIRMKKNTMTRHNDHSEGNDEETADDVVAHGFLPGDGLYATELPGDRKAPLRERFRTEA